jgi:hypothetical protein
MTRFALDLDNLVAWCKRQGFDHTADAEAGEIAIDYQLLGKRAPLFVIVRPDRPMVTLAMRLPLAVAAERADAVTQALNLLNSYVFMGTWLLNTDNGGVYFRVTLPTEEVEIGDGGMKLTASAVVSTAEAFAQKIARVALEGAEPASVVASG